MVVGGMWWQMVLVVVGSGDRPWWHVVVGGW